MSAIEPVVFDGGRDLAERRKVLADLRELIPDLRRIVEDDRFHMRLRLDTSKRWRRWQTRLAVIAAGTAVVTTIVSSAVTILRAAGLA